MIAPVKLILAGVPLGNPGDASARLISAIQSATIVASEDSRRFQRLCQDLNVSPMGKVISFFEGNEEERTAQLIEDLLSGAEVLVVTDAGMPTVSDPGFKLVRDAIAANIPVEVLPGPSAVTTALALSGLPTDRFCFEGFLPRTSGARISALEDLAIEERTMIFFEAPHRIADTLSDAAKVFGENRNAAICREITKTYEEVVRGSLKELITWAGSKEVLGEITLVVAGFVNTKILNTQDLIEAVLKYESAGLGRKEAIAEVAKESGVAKRIVFDAMVEHKGAEGKV